MKYEINSENITFYGKGFKSFFNQINKTCEVTNSSYFIVGAFARDMILENIFNESPGLATKDIDIGIRLDSWEKYTEFIDHLISQYGFKQGEVQHQFISPSGILTDIIPYGDIEDKRKISFPPHHNFQLNMLGFQEVYSSTLDIIIDKEIEIKIASVEGMTILKLIAWKDRQPESVSQKHTKDIGLLIDSYYYGKVQEFAKEFSDLLDVDDFDDLICGARALGRRMKQIAQGADALDKELDNLFDYILSDEENSLFITQLSNSSSWDYTYALNIFKNLVRGFKEFK